jgi:nicotinate phosphoribosyltransferase
MDMQTIKNLRRGYYSDQYFNNTQLILETLASEEYRFPMVESDLTGTIDVDGQRVGDIEVELQFFTRRAPLAVVAGMDEALEILRECAGYYDDEDNRNFVSTFDQLEVEAVPEGTIVDYAGDVSQVKPVLRIRGRYRDFGHLETPLLGVLAFGSRIATNTYRVLQACAGKPVLFFPARFDHYAVQERAGYAYQVACKRFAADNRRDYRPSVSTPAQSILWGGTAGGTTSHSTIAAFFGNPAEMMVQFARIMPVDVPRVALVDFHNDCVADTIATIDALFPLYLSGGLDAERYQLNGVRPDTGGNMVDFGVARSGTFCGEEVYGVNERLVRNLRSAIDGHASVLASRFGVNPSVAEEYCDHVAIIATGGFTAERIEEFEKRGVPVDIYGVGSALIENSRQTNTDFTADIVKVRVSDAWYPLAKVGRRAGENSDLREVK